MAHGKQRRSQSVLLSPSPTNKRPRRVHVYLTVRQRFDQKWVEDTETGCWIWIASCESAGYGRLDCLPRDERKGHWLAHRLSYELYIGPIPEGLVVRHICNNPPCVNPAHLRLGTSADNVADMHKAKRGRGGRKPGTPELLHENAFFDVLTIQAIRTSTISSAEIARLTGYDRSGVSKIRLRKNYTAIPYGNLSPTEADELLRAYVPQKHKPPTEEERFWHRVRKTDSCWLWEGATDSGLYGVFWAIKKGRRRPTRAHRFAYELAIGPIPKGLHVRHLCNTPLCVRPDHLTVGTDADNAQDKVKAGRSRRGLPHMQGEHHPLALLTSDEARYIRFSTTTTRELASELGVGIYVIQGVRSGKTYREAA